MGSARREGECRSDPWLAVLGNEVGLCTPAAVHLLIAHELHQIVLVRAPAESLLYYEGYVKHLSVFFPLLFLSIPSSFFTFHHSMISPCLALSC